MAEGSDLMRPWPALLLLLALVGCGGEADPPGESPAPLVSGDSTQTAVTRELASRQRRLFEAIAARDGVTLTELLSEGFVYYGPSPRVVNAPDLAGNATRLADARYLDALGGSLTDQFHDVAGSFTVRMVNPTFATVMAGTSSGQRIQTFWQAYGEEWRAVMMTRGR